MTRDEWLLTLPKKLVWAELGVFLGDFSKKIFDACEPNHLYLVDIFPEEMWSGDKDGNNVQKKNLMSVPEDLKKYFLEKNVTVLKSTTCDFLNQSDDKDLDIVYIDADHSYDAVFKDLSNSLRRVKSGGLISGHDYSESQFPGVFKAVNDFCQLNELKISFTSSDVLPTYAIRV